MKRILPALLVLVAAAAAPAMANAGSIKTADLPDIFKNEPPYIQNQVCGELLAGMASLTADLYAAAGLPAVKEAAIMAGTRAMVLVKANAALTDAEQARAKGIAEQLERNASASKPVITPYQFCEERVQRWLTEGVVTPADFKAIEADVRAAIDKATRPAKQP